MNFEDLASRLGIDREDFLELVQLFITTCRSDMGKIRRGMAENRSEDAAAAAHSVKGAAANLGFDQMAELARNMEVAGRAGRLEGFEEMLDGLAQWVDRLENQLPEA